MSLKSVSASTKCHRGPFPLRNQPYTGILLDPSSYQSIPSRSNCNIWGRYSRPTISTKLNGILCEISSTSWNKKEVCVPWRMMQRWSSRVCRLPCVRRCSVWSWIRHRPPGVSSADDRRSLWSPTRPAGRCISQASLETKANLFDSAWGICIS